MKILWVGDACVPTGFARVTHAVCDRLHDRGHDVAVLGINYLGDPHDYPYRIYPASHDASRPHGQDRIADVVAGEKPDVVLCLNDIWCMADYVDALKELRAKQDFRFIAYSPMDCSPLPRGLKPAFDAFDMLVSYTKTGYNAMRGSGYDGPLAIIPHGVDTDTFYPMNKAEAKQALGLPQDSFVVLNANRNQPRKRIDLTVRGFMKFAQLVSPRPVVLYLHMGTKDMGWNAELLFEQVRAEYGTPNAHLAINRKVKQLQSVSVDDLRLIYNAADVNVNTCDAEGWGLIAFESAACRVAQIQPDHSACAELWLGSATLTPVKMWLDDPNTGMRRGYIDPEKLALQLLDFATDDSVRDWYAARAFTNARSSEFSWDVITTQFEGILSA